MAPRRQERAGHRTVAGRLLLLCFSRRGRQAPESRSADRAMHSLRGRGGQFPSRSKCLSPEGTPLDVAFASWERAQSLPRGHLTGPIRVLWRRWRGNKSSSWRPGLRAQERPFHPGLAQRSSSEGWRQQRVAGEHGDSRLPRAGSEDGAQCVRVSDGAVTAAATPGLRMPLTRALPRLGRAARTPQPAAWGGVLAPRCTQPRGRSLEGRSEVGK